MRFDYLDERDGLWSKVVTKDDRVEFQPTGTYTRGRIVGIGLALLLLYMLAKPLTETGGVLGWCLLAMTAAVITKVIWSAAKKPKAIVVFDGAVPQCLLSAATERAVPRRNLAKVVVRENTGRESDDFGLAQMYLVLKHDELAVLAHQKQLHQADQVRALAEELADRWGVRVIDQFNSQ